MKKLPVFILLCLFVSVSAIMGPSNSTAKVIAKPVQKTDTYLEAYSKSRIEAEKAKQGVVIVTAKDGEKKIANRDDSFSGYDYTPYSDNSGPGSSGPSSSFAGPVKFETDITYSTPTNSYGPPAQNYGPPAQSYGPPAQNYGPPAQNYGPPAQNYGPPAHNYGPPAQSYGPPSFGPPVKPFPVYGPPLRPSFGVPYTAPGLGFFDKIALKLDLLTIAKIMLKFLIFKKIVTMIAVVCMLLIIPKIITFKKDVNLPGGSGDEDERIYGRNMIELSSIQEMYNRAISVYSRQQDDCGVACRLRHVIDDFYQFQPYFRQTGQRLLEDL